MHTVDRGSIQSKGDTLFNWIYGRCSKLLDTCYLPKKARQTVDLDHDQTLSSKAVWSVYSPFFNLSSILWIPAYITNILFKTKKR